ncbi:N-acetyl-gamma-glutamyl-phosphate reductase, partial [Candidatus Woesearchaeota archaeon CG_4_10_14_0_2_um_filter_57_5]
MSQSNPVKIGIIGGSGYVGKELLRILLQHPGVEIAAVSSRSSAGKSIADVHRSLAGLTTLTFTGD